MARPSKLADVAVAVEDAFAEAAATVDTRLQVLGQIDLSTLNQERENINPTVRYAAAGVHDVRMPQRGEISLNMMLTGHGGSAAAALTPTDLAEFLEVAIGGADFSAVGTTIDDTSTATALEVAGGTFPAGTLARVGVIGDGRGNGQAAIVDELDNGTLTLKNALDAAPNASDVVHAMQMIYPIESADGAEGDSLRMLLQTANKQYLARGCYPTSFAFANLGPGQIPRVTTGWAPAQWQPVSEAFPSALPVDPKSGAPNCAGSFVLQQVGTTTRQKFSIRSFELAINYEAVPLLGPGSGFEHTDIIGYRRIWSPPRITFQVDAPAASATPFWEALWNTDENGAPYFYGVYTPSAVNGRAVAFAFPRLKFVSPRPTQMEAEGLNRVQIVMDALTDESGATDLERSSFRIGLG